VFPDGRVELIVHHGDRFSEFTANEMRRQPRGLLVGQLTQAIRLREGPAVGVIAARLRPAAVGILFRTHAPELTDRTVDLRDLAGHDGRDLVDAVASARTTAGRILALEAFLVSRISEAGILDRQIAAAAELLKRRGGIARISRVADAVAMSPRHLQRRFTDAVGLPPKQFARILRFQLALGRLQRGASLSRAAYACGYYDHPHFSRECREIAGLPPSLVARIGPLSRYFIHDPSDSYKHATGV
jgi:AraC-like DNA-binding protein